MSLPTTTTATKPFLAMSASDWRWAGAVILLGFHLALVIGLTAPGPNAAGVTLLLSLWWLFFIVASTPARWSPTDAAQAGAVLAAATALIFVYSAFADAGPALPIAVQLERGFWTVCALLTGGIAFLLLLRAAFGAQTRRGAVILAMVATLALTLGHATAAARRAEYLHGEVAWRAAFEASGIMVDMIKDRTDPDYVASGRRAEDIRRTALYITEHSSGRSPDFLKSPEAYRRHQQERDRLSGERVPQFP